jgi:hypothetical protein
MSTRCINRYVVQEHDNRTYIIGRVEAVDFTPSSHDIYLPLIDNGVLIPDGLRDDHNNIVLVPYRACQPVKVVTDYE